MDSNNSSITSIIHIRCCNNHNDEINSIKSLQTENLKSSLSQNDITKEGFVTAIYDPAFLHLMNNIEPSIVAVVNNNNTIDGDNETLLENVVGYALVITRETIRIGNHELLTDLFHNIDMINNGYYGSFNYVVVGQICIRKGFRSKYQIFQRLYQLYKEKYCAKYSHCITEIAKDNPRSLQAHIKVGFKIVHTCLFNGTEFYIVAWDWNKEE